jgi:hypothetical protein
MAGTKHPTREGGRASTAEPTSDDQELKQRFLARAAALAKEPEAFRTLAVTQIICDAVEIWVSAEPEIFQAVYDDPTGRKYWNSVVSEPMPGGALAYTLSAHLADSVKRLGLLKAAILCAFRDAAEAGERWFIGDVSSLLAASDFGDRVEGLEKVKLDTLAAVEWLLAKPRREHLVPQSLRSFLQTHGAHSTDRSPAAPRRAVTKKTVLTFVQGYIDNEQAEGRRPTMPGLAAAASKAGIRGDRELLRNAFRELWEVKRGRPPKTI